MEINYWTDLTGITIKTWLICEGQHWHKNYRFNIFHCFKYQSLINQIFLIIIYLSKSKLLRTIAHFYAYKTISKRSREDELFTAELQDYEVVFRRLSTVVLTTWSDVIASHKDVKPKRTNIVLPCLRPVLLQQTRRKRERERDTHHKHNAAWY